MLAQVVARGHEARPMDSCCSDGHTWGADWLNAWKIDVEQAEAALSTISFQSGTAGQSETVAPCIQSDMQESNSDMYVIQKFLCTKVFPDATASVQLSDTSIDTRVDEYMVNRDLTPIEMEKMHKNNPRKSGEFSIA